MKIKLFAFFLILALAGTANAQDCAAVLRTVRATYEQGRLYELPELMKKCLESGFSDAEKVEAYKILVLAYIYLEEPQKADDAMIQLLHADPIYKPVGTDPAEFKNLFKKFRTKALFRIGLRLGPSTTGVSVSKNYSLFAESVGKGSYSS